MAWLRAVPDEPGLPSAEELAVLPRGVLAERLAEAYRVIAQLTGQVRELTARVEDAVAENGRLAARVEALERQAGEGFLYVIEAPVVRQPVREEAVAGPVAAREGEAPSREAAGRAGHHDETRG